MFIFGSGIMWGTPLADAAGVAVANPTPLIFGTMQETSIDFKFELKQLHGQNQFAVAVGRGKGSVTGKAKMADIRAGFLETLCFGVSGTSGLVSAVYDTVGVAIPTTPFTVTVTEPNSGVMDADLGVIDSTTGRAMTRVASAPATGQYSVVIATGVYTFAAADTGKVVYINYRYTAASTTARKLTLANLPMGYAPTFRADFYAPYQGKQAVFTLNNCISEGMSFGSKNDDFTVPEMSFQAFADTAGNIGTLAFSE